MQMMPRRVTASAGAILGLLALPAAASPCGDRIAALEGRLDDAISRSVATSSGGQGVAAAREGQAAQAAQAGELDPRAVAPTVPFQETGREADATRRAAEAGGGGDRAVQARAALNRARTLDGQSDATGCMDAVTEVERLLAAPR
jgi:hypothetical protein